MLLALAPSSLLAPCAAPARRCGGVRCAAAAGGSPADALRADQDRAFIRRGERERDLLQEGQALEMPRRAAKAGWWLE
jgi:hypothetical protein